MGKVISYSQFSQWAHCPHRWKLNYVDEHREFTGNIHTLFGTSMHEVLQKYLTVMYTETAKKADSLNLESMLENRMKVNFLKIKEDSGEECCNRQDMAEFYSDGISFLKWFISRRGQYFQKKGYELLGTEIAINYNLPGNLKFRGFIDLILFDSAESRLKIYDIKTSTMGWNKYVKKDRNKTDQLLLYKQFYSKQFDFPINRIDVEFFIVKRKLYENVSFPQKRVQQFSPASGTPSLNKSAKRLSEFIKECFTDDGQYNMEHTYRKEASKKNCRFCEFREMPELCDASYYRR